MQCNALHRHVETVTTSKSCGLTHRYSAPRLELLLILSYKVLLYIRTGSLLAGAVRHKAHKSAVIHLDAHLGIPDWLAALRHSVCLGSCALDNMQLQLI